MNHPYVDGLKMLARRGLSEAQVRQRLARRGHDGDGIDDAVARLKHERALDDRRVAEAIARTETAKRRGRSRVLRQIERAGIASAVAKRAVEEVFADIDAHALLEEALARRLRGRASIADDAELGRLYRYLVGQGFEADAVLSVLRTFRRP
jgi:regulatory protein